MVPWVWQAPPDPTARRDRQDLPDFPAHPVFPDFPVHQLDPQDVTAPWDLPDPPDIKDHPVISALWVPPEILDCPDPRLLLVACPPAHRFASTLVSRLVHPNAVTDARRDLTSWNKNNDNINYCSYFYTPVPTSDTSFYHTAERIVFSDTLPKLSSFLLEFRMLLLSLFYVVYL